MLHASSLYSPWREERKADCLSGKGMNESFKFEDKNIVKDEDLSPDLPCQHKKSIIIKARIHRLEPRDHRIPYGTQPLNRDAHRIARFQINPSSMTDTLWRSCANDISRQQGE